MMIAADHRIWERKIPRMFSRLDSIPRPAVLDYHINEGCTYIPAETAIGSLVSDKRQGIIRYVG